MDRVKVSYEAGQYMKAEVVDGQIVLTPVGHKHVKPTPIEMTPELHPHNWSATIQPWGDSPRVLVIRSMNKDCRVNIDLDCKVPWEQYEGTPEKMEIVKWAAAVELVQFVIRAYEHQVTKIVIPYYNREKNRMEDDNNFQLNVTDRAYFVWDHVSQVSEYILGMSRYKNNTFREAARHYRDVSQAFRGELTDRYGVWRLSRETSYRILAGVTQHAMNNPIIVEAG